MQLSTIRVFFVFFLQFWCSIDARGDASYNVLYRKRRAQDWSYSGDTGPDKWPSLGYKDCAENLQSPILLDKSAATIEKDMGEIHLNNYDVEKGKMILSNNGKAVHLRIPHGAMPSIEGGGLDQRYIFFTIDFHFGKDKGSGSAHKISALGDKANAMEMHMAHSGQGGKVAILAFLFAEKEGYTNHNYDPIIKNLANIIYRDTKTEISESFSLMSLTPQEFNKKVFFRYIGSYTHPPCTEGVIWTVYDSIITIGKSQMDEFRKLLSTREFVDPKPLYGNFRPLQERNGREVIWAYPG